jgi:hypothetical protein
MFVIASVAHAQNQLVRVDSFETNSTAFVDVPGSSLAIDAGPNEITLVLWNARLSASTSGTDEAELLLEGRPGTRWGLGRVSDVPGGARVLWSNFDYDVGRPFEVHAKLRATVDGGLARVEQFEAVSLALGPSGGIRTDEAMVGNAVIIGDSQWTPLVQVTVPVPLAQPWLALAQATIEVSNPNGVALRLRAANATYPELRVPGDERSGFVSRGPGARSFFLSTALGTPNLQPNDLVVLEALVNPRVVDGGSSGLTATLRDVRMMLIPASVFAQVQSQAAATPVSQSQGVATPVVSAGPSPLNNGDWELQTFATMVTSDGGLVEHDLIVDTGFAPFITPSATPAFTAREEPLLSTLVLRQVDGTSPRWWARSVSQPLTSWSANFSRWHIDAGVLAPPPRDAGMVVVVDAGSDGGVVDAGADAGTGDLDAGAGPGVEGRYGVGCGCTEAPGFGWGLLLLLGARRSWLISRATKRTCRGR